MRDQNDSLQLTQARFEPGGSGDREFGKQIRGRHTDARGGRGDFTLGAANIGSPPEEVGRQAGGNPHRDRIGIRDARNWRHIGEPRVECVGLATKQHADAMIGLRKLALEFRHLRLRGLQQSSSPPKSHFSDLALFRRGGGRGTSVELSVLL